MKWLLIPLILILSMPAIAAKIRCYSGAKIIYSGKVKDILFDGNSFIFTEIKSGKDYFVSANCIINI